MLRNDVDYQLFSELFSERIKDEVDGLQKQIDALKAKQDFLLHIDPNEKIDALTFKTIGNTSVVKDKNALLALLQGTFPGATDYRYYPDNIYGFHWKGFEISTTTFCGSTVYVDMDWYYKQPDVVSEQTVTFIEEVLPVVEEFANCQSSAHPKAIPFSLRQWGVQTEGFKDQNDCDFEKIKTLAKTPEYKAFCEELKSKEQEDQEVER